MEGTDSSPLSNTIEWLEDEQRQSKALAVRLQQQIDQLLSTTWEQASRLQSAEEALSVASAQLARLPKLEEGLRQLQERLGRLQESQTQNMERVQEAEDKREREREHEREERVELWRKLDSLEKEQESLSARLHTYEESVKRYQDASAELNQWRENAEKANHAVEMRILHSLEQGKRSEQEIARHDRELDEMRKQDEIALGRIQIVADQLRHTSQEIAALRADQEPLRNLGHAVDLQRTEQQRLDKQTANLEQLAHQQGERLDSQLQTLHQVEARQRGDVDRLTDLQQQLGALRQQIADQLVSLAQIEEQQRQRLIAELDQQIKELKQHAAKPMGS